MISLLLPDRFQVAAQWVLPPSYRTRTILTARPDSDNRAI